MVQFECPRHRNPSVLSILGKGKSPQLPLLALWGNKNGLPSMKVKELEIFQNKSGLKGCKWSSLSAPGTETPQSYPYWERENLPTPIIRQLLHVNHTWSVRKVEKKFQQNFFLDATIKPLSTYTKKLKIVWMLLLRSTQSYSLPVMLRFTTVQIVLAH